MRLHSRYYLPREDVETLLYEFDTEAIARAFGLLARKNRTVYFEDAGKHFIGGHFKTGEKDYPIINTKGIKVTPNVKGYEPFILHGNVSCMYFEDDGFMYYCRGGSFTPDMIELLDENGGEDVE